MITAVPMGCALQCCITALAHEILQRISKKLNATEDIAFLFPTCTRHIQRWMSFKIYTWWILGNWPKSNTTWPHRSPRKISSKSLWIFAADVTITWLSLNYCLFLLFNLEIVLWAYWQVSQNQNTCLLVCILKQAT